MHLGPRFAKRVFLIAGLYGIVVLLPQYLAESGIAPGPSVPVARPELLYGFTGVALTWQFVFLLVSRDVSRYRPLMLVGVLEKLSFGLPVVILYAVGRVSAGVLLAGTVDLSLGALFVLAHRSSAPTRS